MTIFITFIGLICLIIALGSIFGAKTPEFQLPSFILVLLGIIFIIISILYEYQNKPKQTNNSIIKSNYNYKYNTFNIMYTKNNDTLALDDIYPYELDSIINSLNK